MSSLPRPEYPRPQFLRNDWLCLNGEWQFEIDQGNSGLTRGLKDSELSNKIVVPFCPESELSGIGHTDFIHAVWYRREVEIPGEWAGRNVHLHFQAVDYDATIWVNGIEVGRHRGGWSPFTCDLTGVAGPGETATIVVRARDPKEEPRPGGKQSNHRFDNAGCHYTRTTGIWQTVWMEPVPVHHLKRPRITPDVANGRFRIEQPLSSNAAGLCLRARLSDEKGEVTTSEVAADKDFAPMLDLDIPEDRIIFWGPGEPNLYDVELELIDADGNVVDSAKSYAGLRSVSIDGKKVLINGRAVFQRLVLDQGYYPDGILTAPTDDALEKDIEISFASGFNGARLHQKVFEERFLYLADKMGYLVWGEFGDWGFRHRDGRPNDDYYHHPAATIQTQWLEVLHRDYSHPCIIGWCPLNETFQPIDEGIQTLDDVTRGLFLATKAMDTTRPVLDVSGYSHRVIETDIYDCHDYSQDPTELRKRQAGLAEGNPYQAIAQGERRISLPYRGQPFFVSEFGGIKWFPAKQQDADRAESWGYGEPPKSIEEFYERFEGQCNVLLDNPDMFGYCYTQLTDIYQEQNGIVFFDRSLKFDMERLRKIQTKEAAIERMRDT